MIGEACCVSHSTTTNERVHISKNSNMIIIAMSTMYLHFQRNRKRQYQLDGCVSDHMDQFNMLRGMFYPKLPFHHLWLLAGCVLAQLYNGVPWSAANIHHGNIMARFPTIHIYTFAHYSPMVPCSGYVMTHMVWTGGDFPVWTITWMLHHTGSDDRTV